MDYRSGRSAMVLYACSDPEETLRRFVAGRGARQIERAVSAGARWIRFAEAPHPKDELDRLLRVSSSASARCRSATQEPSAAPWRPPDGRARSA